MWWISVRSVTCRRRRSIWGHSAGRRACEVSGRVYGLDEGAVLRMAPWLSLLLGKNLVPPGCADDAQDIVDEAAAVKAEAARRQGRLRRGASNDRSPMQTVSPSRASASGVESVDSLAKRATVTPAAVTHFLRQWEDRNGCRLPRDPVHPRRWGPIPAGVADEFRAQSRKVNR